MPLRCTSTAPSCFLWAQQESGPAKTVQQVGFFNLELIGNSEQPTSTRGRLLSVSDYDVEVVLGAITVSHFGNPSLPRGGAIDIEFATLSMSDVVFSHCTAASGGAIFHSYGTVTAAGVDVSLCSAHLFGGGMAVWSSVVMLMQARIEHNTVQQDTNTTVASQVYGGGFYCFGSGSVRVQGSFSHNSITLRQGASAFASYGGGISSRFCDIVVAEGSQLRGNAALEGGGAFVQDGSVYMEGTAVEHNVAVIRGGGLLVLQAQAARVVRSFIANNTVIGRGDGGGVYVEQPFGPTAFEFTSFEDNR